MLQPMVFVNLLVLKFGVIVIVNVVVATSSDVYFVWPLKQTVINIGIVRVFA